MTVPMVIRTSIYWTQFVLNSVLHSPSSTWAKAQLEHDNCTDIIYFFFIYQGNICWSFYWLSIQPAMFCFEPKDSKCPLQHNFFLRISFHWYSKNPTVYHRLQILSTNLFRPLQASSWGALVSWQGWQSVSRVEATEGTLGRPPAGGEPTLGWWEAAAVRAARQPACWRYGAMAA